MSLRSVNYASSPLLASKTPPWRSRFIVAGVALAFIVLAGRAVWVQVLHSDFYQREGEKRFLHAEDVPAGRGNVLDRNGRILAASVPAIDIAVRPPELQATPEQKRALARLAGMTPKALEARLKSHPRFVWLKRGVDAGARAELQALLQQGVVGVELSDSWRRAYPEGEAAAQVVGFTDLEQNGLEGIERVFQDALRGSDGQRTVVRDRLGRVVEHIGEPDAPEPGRDVVLTNDRGEVTPTQAGQMLGISRPQVRKLMDDGRLDFRKVGTHHRITVASIQAFLVAERERRAPALAELARLQNDAGLVE